MYDGVGQPHLDCRCLLSDRSVAPDFNKAFASIVWVSDRSIASSPPASDGLDGLASWLLKMV